ncbi:bifunctional alpha,alpha-trehalose-phosphate synthase (UDP-forming)/trehalose-phosphatase [bacterium]|nr:bifunctional alpha,alpha-trehalose-phosphate synthase (UDP-forming)/trehalose-phosphatase [bacterium]
MRIGPAAVYCGRQDIVWGSARTVNPMDVIAPFSFGSLDTEDRRGVDAIRLRIPVGCMGEIDFRFCVFFVSMVLLNKRERLIIMSQLIIVSNRLPVSVEKEAEEFKLQQSMGGLATGLSSYHQNRESIWIGWNGIASDELRQKEPEEINRLLWEHDHCHSIFISSGELNLYYYGFCNRTLWPLFHNFPTFVAYDENQWQCYRNMNERFRDAVLNYAQPDDTIWVHDYHLMLLPGLLRQALPDAKIGFFLHTPFPSYEIYRLLPWRKEILKGLMGANLIGFHTHDYVNHFFNSVRRLIGMEHSFGQYMVNNHALIVDAFPMGIDYKRFAGKTEGKQKKEHVQSKWDENTKIILSVDRLDYTKGILHRLAAFDQFLEKHPEYHYKVTMLLIAVPSRTHVASYRELKDQLDQVIGRLNGKYASINWMPVWYFYRGFSLEKLIELYRIADVALLTPIRDGMNLIAKEFVAAQVDKQGGLILSEMAGAANELPEALIVNPNDTKAVAEAIYRALEIPAEEWSRRNRFMRERIRRYDIYTWVHDFMQHLESVVRKDQSIGTHRFRQKDEEQLITNYRRSAHRLLLFDLDEFLMDPDRMKSESPERPIMAEILMRLSREPDNEVVLLSGLDQDKLTDMFEKSSVHLYASQGAWIREYEEEWHEYLRPDTSWKQIITPILDSFVSRTPGSYIDEQAYSLFWHYEKVSPKLREARIAELKSTLIGLTANHDVKVGHGYSYIEVRSSGLSKARNVSFWLSSRSWDFILAIGDDWTDEEIFSVLPSSAYSIKIGSEWSKARFWISKPEEVQRLLDQLAGFQEISEK